VYIALDTNAWVSQRMFRSGLGAAFLYAVRQSGARIVLAEITRLETKARLADAGVEAVQRINSGLTTVAAILGRRPDPALPDREALERAIDERFAQLSELILPLPPELGDYERAAARVVEKRPPNERKEQFRDSLLLEQILRRFPTESAFLVTEDSDFFESKNTRKVAPVLAEELRAVRSGLIILPSVEQLLTALGREVTSIDEKAITNALSRDLLVLLMEHASKHAYDIGDVMTTSVEAFLTEDHNQLALSFDMQFVALAIRTDDEGVLPSGELAVSGTATYDLRSATVADVRLDRIRLTTSTGDILQSRVSLFAHGAVSFGRRYVPFTLRRPLATELQGDVN
jgi:hypothetical protein